MKKDFFTTQRLTGLLYLGLAVTGVFAFLFARSQLYVEGDAITTATNLVTKQGLTRFGIASELALVVFQILVALWFFKLFRKIDSFASGVLATFGIVNAIVIFVSSAFWLSAFTLASKGTVPTSIDQAGNVLMLFDLHESLWEVGKLFFGLWLIPMGYLVRKAKMPKLLSWFLIGGGVGYMLSLFLGIIAPELFSVIIEFITFPATIGEFWIIGYLLFKRIKV